MKKLITILFVLFASQVFAQRGPPPIGTLADRVYLEVPCTAMNPGLIQLAIMDSAASATISNDGLTCILKVYSQRFQGVPAQALVPFLTEPRRTATQQSARMELPQWRDLNVTP